MSSNGSVSYTESVQQGLYSLRSAQVSPLIAGVLTYPVNLAATSFPLQITNERCHSDKLSQTSTVILAEIPEVVSHSEQMRVTVSNCWTAILIKPSFNDFLETLAMIRTLLRYWFQLLLTAPSILTDRLVSRTSTVLTISSTL